MTIINKIKFGFMRKSRENKFAFFYENVCSGNWPKILDVGVADVEHSPFDNFLEKKCPHPENITVLSIYPLQHFKMKYPSITTAVYSGGTFPFDDESFDVIHCNAVIEHVGGFTKQVEFVKEMARVSRRFFFTTPSRFFPFETHTNMPFLHYLPKSQFEKALRLMGKDWATGDYMHLLGKSDIVKIIKEARITNFQLITKRFMGFPLHYYVIGEKS